MKVEELRAGAGVVSRDGHKLGKLSHFVVDKDTHKLTHIVIDTGLIRSGEPLWKGGWGLSHDRVVPLGALDNATSDEVRLTMTAEGFKDHSVDYIDEHFERIEDEAPGRLDRSDLHAIAASLPGEPGPYVMYERDTRAPNEVDIQRDSRVWRLRPHEKLGEVERVIFDQSTQQVTALVIRHGFVFSKEVVLPMSYVTEIIGNIVHVEIDDDALRALGEFKPED